MNRVELWDLVGYFLRLGTFGFGGPIALAGYMQRDLVDRNWITEDEYSEGLAFAQMMPGPLAAQLAMWIGYIRHGFIGRLTGGIGFCASAIRHRYCRRDAVRSLRWAARCPSAVLLYRSSRDWHRCSLVCTPCIQDRRSRHPDVDHLCSHRANHVYLADRKSPNSSWQLGSSAF